MMAVSGWSLNQRHLLKRLKWLMYVSAVAGLLALILIVQTHGPDRYFSVLPRYYYGGGGGSRIFQQDCTNNQTADQKSSSVVSVNGSKTLLISAYLEHRIRRPEVRVIAVALRSETVSYRCLFCCQHSMHQSDGYQEIHTDHFGFAYGTADIMCPVPSACATPTHIAVSATGELPQTADGVCSEEPNHWLVEVKNQHCTSHAFRYNFTVCLSTMFDFTNVLQLVQSLEMMKLLGVNRVAVYKTSCNTDTQRVLDYYTETGLMEVIPWSLPRFVNVSRGWLPKHGPGDLHYFGQLAALNDCLYRYMYQSTYLAMQDIDELILPQSVDSWAELLPSLERKHGAIHCYKFRCYVFPTVALIPPPSSGSPRSPWMNTSGVNILEHLHHEPPSSETWTNFKIILDPRAVFTVTVHGTLNPYDQCHWVDKDVARIYHTRSPKQNVQKERLAYDDRLLSYSARLTPAVAAVLQRTNQRQRQKHC